ncbi:porin [uncultured Alsobacter sp.]|uniref:porin n=1 Tax=uncultured Alsobacter sp. TaxID=1748258 RepID=UPI0025CED6B4|nr:porin [uncultured Alsobacter sp.]
MKLMKSLLLGSVAGFAAVAGAQAADLPSKKAAPVEYVRVCSQFGAGFFYVPGSDTCLKVYGRVRADYIYNEPLTRGSNTTTTRARGYFRLDSYTPTDWGPLRATTGIYITRDSGRGFNANGVNLANVSNGNGSTNADVALDWAYIQFAGITAGRIPVSFFEFAPFGGVTYLGGGSNGRGSDYGATNVLAYTATFGGGFSATLAIEDGTERRGAAVVAGGAGFIVNGANLGAVPYAGHAMPDIVGRLDYTGTWGTAMLSGAVHQVRAGNGVLFGAANAIADTVYGYAIQGGVKVNLPMLAPGDALFLQAAYANGANSYTGWSSLGLGFQNTPVNGIVTPDVVYDALGNDHTTKTWSIVGGLLHYWTPTIRQGVALAYGKHDAWGSWQDMSAFTAATNVIWSPVKGFDIGAEVGYQRLTDTPNVVYNAANVAAGSLFGLKKDAWFGRLRFQRDF